MSRWAWVADGLLAVALAITTIVGDLNRWYVDVHPDPEDIPLPLPVPPPIPVPPNPVAPPIPAPSPPLPPAIPEVPHPVPAVEHLLPPADAWELLAAALTALPLVLRRRFPLAVYWVVMGATVLLHQGHVAADATTVTFASGLVAAYSAAMYSPHRTAVVVSSPRAWCCTRSFPWSRTWTRASYPCSSCCRSPSPRTASTCGGSGSGRSAPSGRPSCAGRWRPSGPG